MKDLTSTMDIATSEEEQDTATASEAPEEFPGEKAAKEASLREQMEREKAAGATAGPSASAKAAGVEQVADDFAPEKTAHETPSGSGTSTPKRQGGIPTRPAIMSKHDSEAAAAMENKQMTEEEKELRKKEKKKGGLTPAQKEKLAKAEQLRADTRRERVETLTRKLIDRISVWTETDRGKDVTEAFQQKTRLEVENLKMESFGLDILHAIGQTYISKATAVIKSQKVFGLGGFFTKLKDKGTLAKDTWATISSALDAQMTMEEMAKAEEKGGEDWTDETRMEYERRVTGKILTAAWRGSKFEIQSVLRDVCDAVLGDPNLKKEKMLQRAQALIFLGDIYAKVCKIIAFRHFYT
jgi:hypothetical protein